MTLRLMLKVCSVAALIVLVVFALGPAQWTPRSEPDLLNAIHWCPQYFQRVIDVFIGHLYNLPTTEYQEDRCRVHRSFRNKDLSRRVDI